MTRRTRFVLAICICFAGAVQGRALAVGTSHWTANHEAEFKKGTLHNVVASNLGDLKISRAVKTLLEEDPRVATVNCLVEGVDGTVFAGTGPDGVLLRVKDSKVAVVARLGENTNIFSLLFDNQGRLLIGTGGEAGRVLRIDHPERLPNQGPPASAPAVPASVPTDSHPTEIFSAEDVQYVWAINQTPDGKLYVATGPHGQLFEVSPDGSKQVILASEENNLLSMISDGKDLLYIGTDPNGMVYRINRKTHEAFVLFNSSEGEISCLALDARGNLFVGTSEAGENDEQHGEQAADEAKAMGGRPEGTGGSPIPTQPPANPRPPVFPDPNPGEPNPIPKAPSTHRAGLRWSNDHVALLIEDLSMRAAAPSPDAPKNEKAPPVPAPATTKPAVVPGKPHKVEGNAIYRIDPDGFVTEVFRQNVTVLSLLEKDSILLVGTGPDGLVFQVDPKSEETIVLAKVEPKHVMSLLQRRDGQIMLGLADVGGIATLSSGFAPQGEFTSPVLDATQVSRFGKINLEGSLPPDTTLSVATRSGNVQDPSRTGWSKWSDEIPAAEYVQVPSPAARFLQYRITFTSKNALKSAVVNTVDVAYQMPNQAPVIKGVKVSPKTQEEDELLAAATHKTAPKQTLGTDVQLITWDSEDANGDKLQFSIYYRSGSEGPWILLKDKLTEASYPWDTHAVADGRYFIKVVASDAMANVPGDGKTANRMSDAVVVDNTPPTISDLKAEVNHQTAQISARLVDRTSTIATCEYSLDSNTDWQMVPASDSIFDSPEESVSFTLHSLGVGGHQVTLRATDAWGNQGFQTVLLKVAGDDHPGG